jgi:hypothetical protein
MSVTTLAAAVMMAYAGASPLPVLAYESALVAELPGWYRALQNQPFEYAPVVPIVPNSCPVGMESLASGRCVDDCRRGGTCRRIKVAEHQTIFRDSQGRTTGSATPDGSGGFVYRDAQGRTTGRSSSDSSGATRYWDSGGRSIGTSTGPAPIPFSGQRR